MTVEILAWRIRSKYNETKTLAMVKDMPYAVIMVKEANSFIVHKSRMFRTPDEAELWLREATADGEMLVDPMVSSVEEPPEVLYTPRSPTGEIIHSKAFKRWSEDEVAAAIDKEVIRKIVS